MGGKFWDVQGLMWRRATEGAKLGLSFGVVGFQADGLGKMRESFLVFSVLKHSDAQIVVNLRIIWLDVQGRAVV